MATPRRGLFFWMLRERDLGARGLELGGARGWLVAGELDGGGRGHRLLLRCGGEGDGATGRSFAGGEAVGAVRGAGDGDMEWVGVGPRGLERGDELRNGAGAL